MNCQFCENTFATLASLKFHQNSAKYCLDKQGKNSQEYYTCNNCEKTFKRKSRLLEHQEKCKKEHNMEQLIQQNQNLLFQLAEKEKELTQQNQNLLLQLSEKEKELTQKNNELSIFMDRERNLIKQLEDCKVEYKAHVDSLTSRLENVAVAGATKPTISNTNNIRLDILTDDHLNECARLLTENDIMSVNNLAKFVVKHSFKNRVIATDRTRRTLSYKNQDGRLLKDPLGRQIATRFFTSIKGNGVNMAKEAKERLIDELKETGLDMSESDFDLLQHKINELVDIEVGIKKCSENEQHDLHNNFIEVLCRILPSG